LERYADGLDRGEETVRALFFMIHLLGEKREQRALAPLCRMLLDGEISEDCLGDAITENLRDILIAIGGDDLAALKRVIEAPTADEFARASALEALAWHTRAGALTDSEMRAYLTHLRDTMRPQEECFVWTAWAGAVGCLGYEDFSGDVERLITREFVPDGCMETKDFRRILQRVREDPGGWAGFRHERARPFADSIGTLETWAFAQPEEERAPKPTWEAALFDRDYLGPVTNPFRDVGRNDACPCGSGKKFKKCCLV